jgi:hypothetical protein
MVREGRVFIAGTNGDPDFGSSYSVQALEVGAQVASGSSGTTITVRSGHGFAAGDKYMKSLDVLTYSGTNTVQSVTATTVVVQAAYSVSAGDLLINLGPDTGTASPNYNGNGVTVYTDMDYSTTATNATVTTGSTGRYTYYHKGIARWELVRTGTTLIALYTDTNDPATLATSTASGSIQVYLSPTIPTGLSSSSAAVGTFYNKTSATSGALATNIYTDGIERWSMGMDYYPGVISYYALWSYKGGVVGGAWGTADLMAICWGGAELDLGAVSPRVVGQSGCDGPKFRFNSVFTPAITTNAYSNAYQYEFYCPTIQTSGDGIWAGLFQSALLNGGTLVDYESGGIQVNVTGGSRPGLKIINQSASANKRTSFVTVGKGGSTGYHFGCDIPGSDTQNWSVYDIARSAYSLYVDANGGLGVNTSSGTQFVTVSKSQNAATQVQVENTNAGTGAYAGHVATNGTTAGTLACFSSAYTGDATLQSDAMVYASGAAAMLHFGTAGTKRMTLLNNAAKLGIGVDPPTAELQVNGGIALVDGMTAPSTITGYAYIYVDTADGDLKVKFGDGTVKTIVVDT